MLEFLEKTEIKNGKQFAKYRCICGVEKELRTSAVNSGNTKSCGCHRKKIAVTNGKKVTKHNKSNTPEYLLWQYLKQVSNPKTKIYQNVQLDESWKDFSNFDDWYQSNYKSGYTIYWSGNIISSFTCSFIPTNESKNQKTKNTCLQKYGFEHSSQNEEVKKKTKKSRIDKYGIGFFNREKFEKTCLKKYQSTHFMKTEKYKNLFRNITIKNNQANFIDGKTGAQLAKIKNISASWMNFQIRKIGVDVLKYVKKISLIEKIVAEILNKHNISFKKEKLGKYFPDFIIGNLIIECDGLYWHSDARNKDKNYHSNKKEYYTKSGYISLFFREDEILNNPEIVESIILNKLNKSIKIYARKCKIEKIPNNIASEFCQKNHLMGSGSGESYGLIYNNELVTVMRITKKDIIDISRFCHKLNYNIIGGFSKLLNIFKNNNIQTFIDLRYGSGNYLKELGFIKETQYLSFKWTKNGHSLHRMKFPGKTGYDHGYYKIWDCGQAKWVKGV